MFTHGDLQIAHVFIDNDQVTGILDWSDACQGDALFDLAILTLGHEERLGDVVAGDGTDVDLDAIRGVVVDAQPAGGPMAGRSRFRPLAGGRRASIGHEAVAPGASDRV